MTVEEFEKRLQGFRLDVCKMEQLAIREWVNSPPGSATEAYFNGKKEMAADVLELAKSLDAPEPKPPKKARRINLTNRDGYWYWEVWQEEEPGSWAKVFSMTMGYASIAEAANLARQWMEKNP